MNDDARPCEVCGLPIWLGEDHECPPGFSTREAVSEPNGRPHGYAADLKPMRRDAYSQVMRVGAAGIEPATTSL